MVQKRCECGARAEWIRATQFSGDFLYCDKCARGESDFGDSDPSYFMWDRLVGEEQVEVTQLIWAVRVLGKLSPWAADGHCYFCGAGGEPHKKICNYPYIEKTIKEVGE